MTKSNRKVPHNLAIPASLRVYSERSEFELTEQGPIDAAVVARIAAIIKRGNADEMQGLVIDLTNTALYAAAQVEAHATPKKSGPSIIQQLRERSQQAHAEPSKTEPAWLSEVLDFLNTGDTRELLNLPPKQAARIRQHVFANVISANPTEGTVLIEFMSKAGRLIKYRTNDATCQLKPGTKVVILHDPATNMAVDYRELQPMMAEELRRRIGSVIYFYRNQESEQ